MPIQLRNEIKQEIKARLKLLNYKPNLTLGVNDGSYSIYFLDGYSGVNKPYKFNVTFVSDKYIAIEDIVDTDVQIYLEDKVNSKIVKNIFGKIYSVSEDSVVANKYMYKIEIVNPMYYLLETNKYEIYHSKKSIDIISEIIRRYSQVLNLRLDVKIDSIKTPIQEYITQYDQSDLDFILMLCQKEGYSLIFDYGSNNPYVITLCELNEHAINYKFPSTSNFNHSKTFHGTFFVEDFFDLDNPSLEYKIKNGSNITSSVNDNQSSKQLRIDLQKEKFRDKLNLLDESFYKDLNRYSNIDSLREYSKINQIMATSQELHIKDSICINLEDEKANKNIDVIIIDVNYKGYFPNALDEYVQNSSQMQYEINFTAIPKDIMYKPPLTIIKPKIYGIQTAIVSNSNPNTKDYINTIDTDEKGRVKVIFHFERNQTTSCYLRVSNLSSGTQYGTQFVPRVNSEVIVSFVNGDPDYPIIIGTLHNGENKNPYPLPNNKTKSFIKTYSIPQYENKQGYNEILFEDKRGDEQLNLRAQRDMNTLVLNDKTLNVKNNENVLIEGNKEELINKDSKLTIKQNYTQNIKQNQNTTVEKEKIVSVKEDYNIEVQNDMNITVKQNVLQIIEKNLNVKIDKTKTTSVQNDVKQKYLKNLFQQIVKEYRLDVQKDYHLKAKEIKKVVDTMEIIAEDGISLRVGGNVLSINPNGIDMKTPLVDTTSFNGGVRVEGVKDTTIFNQRFQLINEETGEIYPNHHYRLISSNGEVVEGISDENGFTKYIQTKGEAEITVELL